MRNLILILGDQLDRQSAAFDDLDPGQDKVWMAEVEEGITWVKCHKQRIVFFSAPCGNFATNSASVTFRLNTMS